MLEVLPSISWRIHAQPRAEMAILIVGPHAHALPWGQLQEKLELTKYFYNIPKSMFTAFRCFTGECAAWLEIAATSGLCISQLSYFQIRKHHGE